MSSPTLLAADTAAVLSLPAAQQASEAGIVSRTFLQSPELRVVLFTFAAEQELTVHTTPRRALLQVVAGRGEFFFAETWRTLETGDLLHLPPSAPHAVRAAQGPFSFLLTLSQIQS